MGYAEGTTVDVMRSRLEVERLLQKAECSHVGVMHEPGKAIVFFQRRGWQVQMTVPIPMISNAPQTRRGRWLTDDQKREWVEQQARERWRQLLLALKAKFTALENGLETFEQTFLAHLVVGGVHLGDRLLPAVRQAQEKGTQLQLGAGAAPPKGHADPSGAAGVSGG